MRTKFKSHFIYYLLILALSLSFLSPSLSFAQTGKGNESFFCKRLPEIKTKMEQKMAEAEAKIQERQEKRISFIENKRNERNNIIQKHRARWDANRQEHYAKLEERAKNETQKQAVVEFQRAVERAVNTRRTAIDTANSEFQAIVDRAIADRKIAIERARRTFKDAVSGAFEKAELECAMGIDPKTVRQNLHANLKTAQEKFKSDLETIGKIGEIVKSAAETRKQAIERAIQDFKTAIEEAKENLKSAFAEK